MREDSQHYSRNLFRYQPMNWNSDSAPLDDMTNHILHNFFNFYLFLFVSGSQGSEGVPVLVYKQLIDDHWEIFLTLSVFLEVVHI